MYKSTSIPTTPCQLLIPKTTNHAGIVKKEYIESDIFFCIFKSYGGTNLKGAESSGDIIKIVDTANCECYYNPNITSSCKIKNLVNNKTYEIINEIEDVECRHMLMKFKVQCIKGGL